jgi:hypothetical protein
MLEQVCGECGLSLTEDVSWGSTKMAVMALASLSALVAQFYPLTFPANIWLLGVCVAIYFLLSGVLQYMVLFLDKELVYTSLPSQGQVARLHTRLPKGSQTYTFSIEFPVGTLLVDKAQRSVGEFYREDGYLVPENVKATLKQLLEPALKGSSREAAGGKAAGKS